MKFILTNFLAEHKPELCLACANALVFHFYSKSKRNYDIGTFLPLVISSCFAGSLPLINGSENTHRSWILRCLLGIPIIYCHVLEATNSRAARPKSNDKSNPGENHEQKIAKIRNEADGLKAEILNWTDGPIPNKKYFYFEESFLKLLDDLDRIITTDESIRRDKRQAIRYIHECLDVLDDTAL